MATSTCWACGGASSICEECGDRGMCWKSAHEEMETAERHYYWRGSVGQYSNPFRSRGPELSFIVPAIANPLLLRV
jgi:hypothetical protein